MNLERYETRPLKTWQMAKQLVQRHFDDIAKAKERGKLRIASSGLLPAEILSGLDMEWIFGETYSANNAFYWKDSPELHEVVEQKGYDRNLCHYMKCYLSSMFLNRGFIGEFPRPDICVPDAECTTHAKWMERVAEHFDVPFFSFDHPYLTGRIEQYQIEYYKGQLYEFVEWVQRVTGREWVEERFIQGFMNMMRTKQLWSEITDLQKTIPAPLDLKSVGALMPAANHIYLKKEAVEFYELLLEEVQERVAHRIAAVPYERCRLSYVVVPPWYQLRDLRYMEQYGAVFVANAYMFWWGTDWWHRPDGTYGRPDWIGKEPKNLDEAFTRIAERTLGHPWRIEDQIQVHTKVVKECSINATVIHCCRGCEAFIKGWEAVMAPIAELGVPCLAFEGSQADPRDYTSSQVTNRMDIFLESLGLTKLTGT